MMHLGEEFCKQTRLRKAKNGRLPNLDRENRFFFCRFMQMPKHEANFKLIGGN